MSLTVDIYYKILNQVAAEEKDQEADPENSRYYLRRRMDMQSPENRFRDSDALSYGKMSVLGRQRSMEDVADDRLSFCRPAITMGQPVHFFGVFDGHGGAHIAAACSLQMHEMVRVELMRVVNAPASAELKKQLWREVMRRAFLTMDRVAVAICICGRLIADCGGCRHIEVVHAGCTALVAVLTPEHIVVANCGNSRAVLCRGGAAIPLSRDHKPDRADELARITAAGGRVIDADGARVEGILPMSRAIGDKYFKPIVTPEPETTVTDRNRDDECLILASDGLWNEMTIDMACRVASRCLREGGIGGMDLNSTPQSETEMPSSSSGAANHQPESPSHLAATLLTRLALGRKSTDNISVIVIDLRKR